MSLLSIIWTISVVAIVPVLVTLMVNPSFYIDWACLLFNNYFNAHQGRTISLGLVLIALYTVPSILEVLILLIWSWFYIETAIHLTDNFIALSLIASVSVVIYYWYLKNISAKVHGVIWRGLCFVAWHYRQARFGIPPETWGGCYMYRAILYLSDSIHRGTALQPQDDLVRDYMLNDLLDTQAQVPSVQTRQIDSEIEQLLIEHFITRRTNIRLRRRAAYRRHP
ncbi:hypothetical protein F4804DRAFT_339093 [Jackrogersella minutella]|nr:hypothetical protein F4804DRAFT_339093 [Jackrogersella minutella]